jgi:hypothetical protein
VAALFIFQTGYVRYHLLTEVHHDVPSADIADAAVQPDDHDDGEDGDHHDSDHHRPHPAGDHLIPLFAKHPSSLLADYFLGSQVSVHLAKPDANVVRIFSERIEIPGESPPDPLQPRAPPLA